MVKGAEKIIYGVLGYPVKHSLSPAMHNASFAHLKINAEYRLFEIKPEELDNFLSSLVRGEKDICGLNVTVPYKEKVLDFVKLDAESFYLRQIGAVNTIVNRDGVWKGFNTDIPGFSRHLKEQFEPKGRRAAVIGAGGASRAVCYVLAKAGAKEIRIFDIDGEKAVKVEGMIKTLFAGFPISRVSSIEELEIKNKDLLVNATPIGLKVGDPSVVEERLVHENLFVYDLIYNPQETRLLTLAKKKGAKTSNGLGMLLYQGALSFEHFTGQEAPLEVMRKALKEGVKELWSVN